MGSKPRACVYELRIKRYRRSGVQEMGAGTLIHYPEAAATLIQRLTEHGIREQFFTIFLDVQHRVIGYEQVAKGHQAGVDIHPAEVFRAAITAPATAIIIGHNHPSGNAVPSDDDRELTTRLRLVGELLGIPLLDHVIVTEDDYFSFSEHNQLGK